jgi:hypothetical protein
VRGIPSPFIKIYERGWDTPHPSLLPLVPPKDFLDGVPAALQQRQRSNDSCNLPRFGVKMSIPADRLIRRSTSTIKGALS